MVLACQFPFPFPSLPAQSPRQGLSGTELKSLFAKGRHALLHRMVISGGHSWGGPAADTRGTAELGGSRWSIYIYTYIYIWLSQRNRGIPLTDLTNKNRLLKGRRIIVLSFMCFFLSVRCCVDAFRFEHGTLVQPVLAQKQFQHLRIIKSSVLLN